MNLWHYLDVWGWTAAGWALIDRAFRVMAPHQAAGTFDSMTFQIPAMGIARWFAFDKGQWVSVDQERRGF